VKSVSDQNMAPLEALLCQLRECLEEPHSHLLELFDAFADEARYGRRLLASSLRRLPRGARILEVGGGLMLLSTALQCEGFEVTAVEPVGSGFSAFHELQAIVLAHAVACGHAPQVLRQRVEDIDLESQFDFAFSINVMEHVDDIDLTIRRVLEALRGTSAYRFTCPNYLFPYEPHFNILALPSKALTGKLMRRWIDQSTRVYDREGMWASLNWITVPRVRRAVRAIPCARLQFHSEILSDILERVVHDDRFAARRSLWIRRLVTLAVAVGMHRLLAKLPASLLPVMDCSVERVAT